MTSHRLEEAPRMYYKLCDILHWHGLFAIVGYCISYISKCSTPTRLFLRIPNIKRLQVCACIYNKKFKKATPLWHDIGIIILVGVTYLVIRGALGQKDWATFLSWWASWILLVDMTVYHVSVLWFDDLGIRQTVNHRKVWSHRRILFQAIINFAQSICLFAVLYHGYQLTAPFMSMLQDSFTIATTFTRPGSLCVNVPNILVDVQVCVSIFFLVVVISVVASIGYNRPELGKSFKER